MSVSDPLFFVRLKKLIRIVIPSIRSREAAMLALHSGFLLLRTGISLYVADLDGRWVKSGCGEAVVDKQDRLDFGNEPTSSVSRQFGQMASNSHPSNIHEFNARIPPKRARSGISYKVPHLSYFHVDTSAD